MSLPIIFCSVKMSVSTMILKMAEGLGGTFTIFGLTLLFSIPLGVLIALGRMCKWKVISLPIQFIISVLRGTPLMLQLIAIAYGPYLLFGLTISRNKLIPVIIAFSINYAAYFAEIFRGGIQSVPVGQWEGANVLGYNKGHTFLKIILPQTVRRVLPAMTNEIITLVKDTSMAFTIGYVEMYTIGKQIANSATSFLPFLIAGVFYYIANAVITIVMGRVEKAMSYYKI